jgi:4a-hydroxytetrahydrobiopterin dehydratase
MRTLLSPSEITTRLATLPGWTLDGAMIRKSFTVKNFAAAIGFCSAIAVCAEKLDHHPDLLIHDYKKIDVMISTHSEKGITEMDFSLAKEIEALGLA